ncbi:hypothetical protein POSPLADRAFT_1055310 [Postia placenta MAD-698-R-SB12]|uniref:Uncharacterized protein n=1 Tax=Postia placenta MAD-698-R-SB12 TaxID=670580 RepID=A0A1X6N3P3_9APHY|nr:hypothetical protein POSPLADRAFT_1055310 [Postia placenta MAD-698-R-SB12]OSX63247.1 hypothetical protein POSPLADRAFT_1055310 [Postia placenta MAD-698-R-SB12]
MPPLAPGAIAGLVLAILALLSIVSAACIVLHRRRKAVNSNMPIFHPSTPDLEKAGTRYSPSLSGFSNKKLRKNRRKAPPVLPADLDHDIFSPACVVLAGGSGAAFAIAAGNGVNPSCSTLNVDISPSLPRVFKVKTEGGTTFGMEVRVTPPTPSAGRGELPSRRSEFSIRRLVFGGSAHAAGMASTDSRWWHM